MTGPINRANERLEMRRFFHSFRIARLFSRGSRLITEVATAIRRAVMLIKRHPVITGTFVSVAIWLSLEPVAKWAMTHPSWSWLSKILSTVTSDSGVNRLALLVGVLGLLWAVWIHVLDRRHNRPEGFPFKQYRSSDTALLRRRFQQETAPPRKRIWPATVDQRVWDTLRRESRILIMGRSGLGKTRLCLDFFDELAIELGEEVTVLVPDENFVVPSSLPEDFNPRHVVLFIDDFHVLASDPGSFHHLDHPALRPVEERLAACIQFFQKRGTSFRVIITVRTDDADLTELTEGMVTGFATLELPHMDRSEVRSFAQAVAGHVGLTLTPDAIEEIYRKSDLSCAGITTTLMSIKLRNSQRQADLRVEDLQTLEFTYPQAWTRNVYPEQIEPVTNRRAIFEALAVLNRLRIAPSTNLVIELALSFSGADASNRTRNKVRKVLEKDLGRNWLIVQHPDRVFCRPVLLQPVRLPDDWPTSVARTVSALMRKEAKLPMFRAQLPRLIISLESEDSRESRWLLDDLLEYAPGDPELLATRAMLLTDAHPQAALTDADAAVSNHPSNVNAAIVRSMVLSALEQHDSAIQEARRATVIGPHLYFTWLVLGVAKSKRGDIDGAIEALQKACELNDGSAKASYSCGIALERSGRIDEARERFAKATALAPYNAIAWRTRAIFELRHGESAAAVAMLERAVALRPRDITNLVALAKELRNNGQLSRAETLLREYIVDVPEDGRAYAALSHVLLADNRRDAALSIAKQAMKWSPGHPEVVEAFGICHLFAGEASESVRVFSALAHSRKRSTDYSYLADAHRLAEEYEQAAAAAGRAIELDVEGVNWRARSVLGKALYRLERYAAAERAFEESATLRSERAPLADQVDGAKIAAVRANPSSALAWKDLAENAFKDWDARSFFDVAKPFLGAHAVPLESWDLALTHLLRLAPRRSADFLTELLRRHGVTKKRQHFMSIAARYCHRLEDADAAAEYCVNHASNKEEYADYWYQFGRVCQAKGDERGAVRAFTQAERFCPGRTKAADRVNEIQSGPHPASGREAPPLDSSAPPGNES